MFLSLTRKLSLISKAEQWIYYWLASSLYCFCYHINGRLVKIFIQFLVKAVLYPFPFLIVLLNSLPNSTLDLF